ncbi:hypothetical protein SUGI_0826930 [Cryptomeria japonica]|nr:hypothetical protein SUGI_0826930 [Cryptomeria japonica]
MSSQDVDSSILISPMASHVLKNISHAVGESLESPTLLVLSAPTVESHPRSVSISQCPTSSTPAIPLVSALLSPSLEMVIQQLATLPRRLFASSVLHAN